MRKNIMRSVRSHLMEAGGCYYSDRIYDMLILYKAASINGLQLFTNFHFRSGYIL
jgi:hypothetical protein